MLTSLAHIEYQLYQDSLSGSKRVYTNLYENFNFSGIELRLCPRWGILTTLHYDSPIVSPRQLTSTRIELSPSSPVLPGSTCISQHVLKLASQKQLSPPTSACTT